MSTNTSITAHDHNEVVSGEPGAHSLLGAHADGSSSNPQAASLKAELQEATDRHVSEYDLAAYTKDEFTLSMQKNIMRRIFDVFDAQQDGYIKDEDVPRLLEYLGHPVTADENSKTLVHDLISSSATVTTKKDGSEAHGVTFEAFWPWWLKYDSDKGHSSKESFATACSEFKPPFQQQQLVTEEVGEKFTPTYRVNFYFQNVETTETKRISPWHDVPLYVRDLVRTHLPGVPSNRYNMVVEIPKWTRAKFEISTKDELNPIKQDMKNGVPRFYKHGDMMWNYGAFPQTWESTEVEFSEGITGDNDPLDCIDIGMVQYKTGDVIPVKVLGVLGMIDDGQMDWKVIVICKGDPMEPFLNDVEDVPKYLPGCLDALREWLRVYKICQGGVENKFVNNGAYHPKAYAMKLVEDSHLMWGHLNKVQKTAFFKK